MLHQLVDLGQAIALDHRVSAAAVHVQQDRVGVVERRGIVRPAVVVGGRDDAGQLVAGTSSSSFVPALNSWSPGPWLGVPATITIFLPPSASLVRLSRMFLNCTIIGGPACSCRARMPLAARLSAWLSMTSAGDLAVDLVRQVVALGDDFVFVPVFLLDVGLQLLRVGDLLGVLSCRRRRS